MSYAREQMDAAAEYIANLRKLISAEEELLGAPCKMIHAAGGGADEFIAFVYEAGGQRCWTVYVDGQRVASGAVPQL